MSLFFENDHDHRPGFPSSLTSSCQRKKTKETLILSVFVLVSRRTNALSVTPFLFCPTFLLPISAYTRRFDLFDFMISMWLSLLSPRFQASGSYLWSLLCIHAALLADIVTNKAVRCFSYVTAVSHASKTWLFTFTATIVTRLHSKHRVNVSALLLKACTAC